MIYTIEFIRDLSSQYADAKIDNIGDFIENYKQILEIDSETPIFSRTSKYKSFPKKHFKKRGNHIVVRGGSNFKLFTPNSDIERIQRSVRGTLNKINDSNSKRIIAELQSKISQFNSVETLNILAAEVHRKIIFDKQFQGIYIVLCSQIWSMQDWHDQLVTIVDNDGELYWGHNYNVEKEDTTLHGPFTTEEALRADSRKNVNFRRTLLNLLQAEFAKRDVYLRAMDAAEDDSDRFKAKRHIVAIVEFICKLYLSSKIGQAAVHTMFFDLLSITELDDNEKPLPPPQQPHSVAIETFVKGWQVIQKRKFHDQYMKQYLGHVERLLNGYAWDNRMRFMLEDLLNRKQNKKNSWVNVASSSAKPKLDYDGIEGVVSKYRRGCDLDETVKKLKGVDSRDLFEIVLNAALDQPDDADKLAVLMKGVKTDSKVLQEVFNEFMENIDDIKIDIPRAPVLMDGYKKLFLDTSDSS